MKLSKTKTILIFGIPIAIGLYLIARQLIKPKAGDVRDVPPPPPPPKSTGGGTSGGTSGGTTSQFPLKKGSKNSLVGTLQALLNACGASPALATDNQFGSKTETALVALYGQSTVANQSGLDALRATCKNKSALSSNLDWAWKLIDAYNSDNFNNNSLVVLRPITLSRIKKNFQGQWKKTGMGLDLPAHSYNLHDYALRSAMNNGTLRIEINTGANAGMYSTPEGINLSDYLDIQ